MRSIAGLFLASLVVAGCGGGDEATGTSSATPTTPTSAELAVGPGRGEETGTPGSADVAGMLLSIEDMPSGWTVSAPESEPGPASQITCFTGVTPGADDAVIEDGRVRFERSDPSSSVHAFVARYEDPDAVAGAIERMLDAISACNGTNEVDEEGRETTYAVQPLPFAYVGDMTAATRVWADTDDGRTAADIVATQVADLLIFLAHVGTGGVDTDLTWTLQDTMAGRA